MRRVKQLFVGPIKPMSMRAVAVWLFVGWAVAYLVSPRPIQPSSLWLWVLILVVVLACWLITNVEAEFAHDTWYSVYALLEDSGVTYCTGKFDYDGALECHEDLEDWLWLMAEKYGTDRSNVPVATGIVLHVDNSDLYRSLSIEADSFF